jgi:hypothetical protein
MLSREIRSRRSRPSRPDALHSREAAHQDGIQIRLPACSATRSGVDQAYDLWHGRFGARDAP